MATKKKTGLKRKFDPAKKIQRQALALVKRKEHNVEVLTKEHHALKLAKKGKSYEEIAMEVGVTPAEAFQLVRDSVEKWAKTMALDAAQARTLELQRLDAVLAIIWPEIEGREEMARSDDGSVVIRNNGQPLMVKHPPSLTAVKIFLEIQERRAKYLGLDSATKIEAKVDHVVREYIGVNPSKL